MDANRKHHQEKYGADECVRKQAFWDRFSLFFGADLVILKMGNFEDMCFKFAQRTPVLYI